MHLLPYRNYIRLLITFLGLHLNKEYSGKEGAVESCIRYFLYRAVTYCYLLTLACLLLNILELRYLDTLYKYWRGIRNILLDK